MNAHTPTASLLIDLRLVTLSLAAAWCELVEADEMSLDDAFDRLVEHVEALVPPAQCEICIDRQRRKSPPKPPPRRTPVVTVEAIKHTIKERGPDALEEPANRQRLRRCDAAAFAEIDEFIAKLKRGAR